ncbi:MAG: hypothetical protein NC311_00040 [Muribaculaceae bacterium]|nr:hypothetical protein [Muribaculaceae bacterium]
MKKIAILSSLLALTACGTYHNGKMGMTLSNPDVEFVPMQVKVNVDASKKITGTAECGSFLWVFNNVPQRQTYGPTLQTETGNLATESCTAAAVYDAMNQSQSDVIIAPQYTSMRNGAFCFGHRCLFGTTKVIVNGYSGKITAITDKDTPIVREKQKNSK